MSKLNDKHDRVAELIRLAGARPAVPEDRAARVKHAARQHWLQAVDRRTHRRRIWTGTLAVAATLALVFSIGVWLRSTRSGNPVLVESVLSSVWLHTGGAEAAGGSRLIRTGDAVSTGDELATEDAGRVALRLASGHSVRLDAGTRLRVLSERSLALDRGAVYVDSNRGRGREIEPIEIHTAFGVVRDIGTQFEVRTEDDGLSLRVREGQIRLAGHGEEYAVEAGTALEIDATGHASRRSLSAFGSEWDWVREVTPMIDLEGLTLQQFLDWITRERGLRLVFADASIHDSASEIVLNGSLQGLTLDQALDAVLPTCRLSYRIDDEGLLLIEELTGE